MREIAAYQQLDVLASDGSLFALGARNWIQFTLSLKRGRERNYILVRVVIKHLFWVCLLKMLIGKKFSKEANASIYCNVRGMNMFSYCIGDL